MRDRSHPLELLRQAAAGRAAAGVRRALVPRGPGHDGLVDLASNDYLGLCGDERITAAAAEAAWAWGTGSTGSRLVTGTVPWPRWPRRRRGRDSGRPGPFGGRPRGPRP